MGRKSQQTAILRPMGKELMPAKKVTQRVTNYSKAFLRSFPGRITAP